MPRVALAFAYDGTRFDSYARQPRARTVEGELLTLLSRGKIAVAHFQSASRTDKGVSAAWNVCAFETDAHPKRIVAATADAPEGLHLLSAVIVPAGFEVRWASRRRYRYRLDHAWDWKRLAPLAQRFKGEHDFTNFRRADGDKAPIVKLEAIRYRSRPVPAVEFEAPFFLWQQVRRIVAAFEAVNERTRPIEEVTKALLEPQRRVDLGLAAAEPLMLVEVAYDSVVFPPIPKVARARLERELADARRRSDWASVTLGNGPTERR